MTDHNDEPDPEELLNQTTDQRRTTTQPSASEEGETVSLEEAVADAFDEIENGDINSTFGFRDERIVALLVGIERAGELEDVVSDAQRALGREVDVEDVSRSEAARLLIRLGIQALDEELLEIGSAAYQKHLRDKADNF